MRIDNEAGGNYKIAVFTSSSLDRVPCRECLYRIGQALACQGERGRQSVEARSSLIQELEKLQWLIIHRPILLDHRTPHFHDLPNPGPILRKATVLTIL